MSPRVYDHIDRLLRRLGGETTCVIELCCGGKQYGGAFPVRVMGFDIEGGIYDGPGPDVLADVRQLPVAAASADLVFVVAALLNIPQVERVFDEAHRILRPGGRFVIFDYNLLVARRALGVNRFTSLGLAWRLYRAGLKPFIHLGCVPPNMGGLSWLTRFRPAAWLLYLVSNWVVVSGSKPQVKS